MTLTTALVDLLGPGKVVTSDAERRRLSRDFYWYSQVLEAQLDDRVADAVVLPESEAEVLELVRFAQGEGVPLTMRGAGTGNYGQAVPLHGGIVLDMTRMARVLEVSDGYVRAEAGARMSVIEAAARAAGQESRVFPSTYEKSTVAGFVCGGAGGVGSVTYGWLWDGNVLGCRMVTAELPPQARVLATDETSAVIHGYGLTGILTEVTLPLVPKQEWAQLVVTFGNLDELLDFSERLTADPAIKKRLVSVSEASMSPLFNVAMPLIAREERHPALLVVAGEHRDAVLALAGRYGGELERDLPSDRHPMATDFCFNHVTLWAKKKNPAYTYIQAGFLTTRIHEQIALVKARYGDSVIHHFEYVTTQGAISPGGLLVLPYESDAQIDEVMTFLQEIDVWVTNPHTFYLDAGTRRGNQWAGVLAAKSTYDPCNILNPGKVRDAVAV